LGWQNVEDHLSAMVESSRDAVSVPGDEGEIADRLARLAGHWFEPGAKLTALEQLSGGASQETWSFDVDASGSHRPLILRRNPVGAAKREMVAGMETEARLIRLAEQAGAPVPRVVHVLAPEEGLGSGFVMERIEGESLARKLLRDPQYAIARTRMAFQIGAAAARIHQIDPARAGELRRATIRSSLGDATALYRTNGKRRPVVEWALRWLEVNRPASDPVPTVVHGDLRNGNLIAGPEGLRAVLDWELVHLGDPMEDLGWACVASWRFGNLDKPAGGFGSREQLFAGYESAGGRPVEAARVQFWEVLGTVRWGLICAMMANEFRAGDLSVERAAIGRRASETEIDLLALLAPKGTLHA
jgi:aminoglycoside phosphotransferase (APT) family kinase protein